MAATVTRLRRTRRIVGGRVRLHRMKAAAHRRARHRNRQLLRVGRYDDIFERPELTGWDVV